MQTALDHAPVERLLRRLAKKAQRSEKPEVALPLNLDVLPEVFGSSSGEDADFHWSFFKDAEREGLVRIQLSKASGPCAEYERSPKLCLNREHFDRLRHRLNLGATPEASAAEQWTAALQAGLKAPRHVVDALANYHVRIPGQPPAQVVEGLNRLLELKGQLLFLREASSRAFQGLSKVLDSRTRQELVATLFELEECPFPPAPVQVNICLPANALNGVLFIENWTTFERMARKSAESDAGLALIYSGGFSGAAKRLKVRRHAALFYSRETPFVADKALEVESVLFDDARCPTYFFGDLDFSGAQILKSLRGNYPGLTAWESGYAYLLAHLSEMGHTPKASEKAGQKDPGETGCRYTDSELLPALRATGLFVDQEIF